MSLNIVLLSGIAASALFPKHTSTMKTTIEVPDGLLSEGETLKLQVPNGQFYDEFISDTGERIHTDCAIHYKVVRCIIVPPQPDELEQLRKENAELRHYTDKLRADAEESERKHIARITNLEVKVANRDDWLRKQDELNRRLTIELDARAREIHALKSRLADPASVSNSPTWPAVLQMARDLEARFEEQRMKQGHA